MKKNYKNKKRMIFIFFLLFIFLFSKSSVLAAQSKTVSGKENKTGANDSQYVIHIPTDIEQSAHASWMSAYYSGHQGNQKKIQELWKNQGSKADNNNWAYIEIGGLRYYLIALAEYTFGDAGDFVDVYVEHNGQEKGYNCILGDTKRNDCK